MSGGMDTFKGMTNLFKNGASKLVSVGGGAVDMMGGAASMVGGAASKVGGAVVSTTSVVAN